MRQALADFRIENDGVVMLAFANGKSYRVSPDDLERCLRKEDLVRVQRALRLRRQFVRRILPPTAIILVVAAIIGLGGYDASNMARSWQPLTPPKTQAPVSAQPVTQSQPASHGVQVAAPATPVTSVPAAASSAGRTPMPSTGGSPVVKGSDTKSLTSKHPDGDTSHKLDLGPVAQPIVAPLQSLPVVKDLGL